MVKNLLPCRRPRFDPWVGKIPRRREWQLTPVFWPGEFHGQRNLVGYSPWSHKKLDSNEQLTLPKGLKSERENVTMEAVVGVTSYENVRKIHEPQNANVASRR